MRTLCMSGNPTFRSSLNRSKFFSMFLTILFQQLFERKSLGLFRWFREWSKRIDIKIPVIGMLFFEMISWLNFGITIEENIDEINNDDDEFLVIEF